MHLSRRTTPVLLAAAVLCTGSTHAQNSRTPAFAPRILIDRELKQRPVKLAGFDSKSIQIVDIGGLIRTEPVEKYLAIVTQGPVTTALTLEDRATDVPVDEIPGVLPWAPGETSRASLLTLADGQRLTGRPDARETAPDQFITWTHPTFGSLRFPIDRIKRIDVAPASVFALTSPAKSKDDQLLLANGDRLEGFVASVSNPLSFEVDKKPISLPWQRIATVFFAAPLQRAEGSHIWLADGSVIKVASIAAAPGRVLRVTPASQTPAKSENPSEPAPTNIPLGAIAAIAFDASQIAPLAGLPLAEPKGAQPATRDILVESGLDQPLGAGSILFQRPASGLWVLPPGATRIAFHAELPPDCWSWGDCELVVSVIAKGQTTQLLRQHLSAETAEFDVNLPLTVPAGAELSIAVEEGRYGPIQDRVILRRGLVQIANSPR